MSSNLRRSFLLKQKKHFYFIRRYCLDTAARAELPQDVHLVPFVEGHAEEGVNVVVYGVLDIAQQYEVLSDKLDRLLLGVSLVGGVRVHSEHGMTLPLRDTYL